VLSTDLAGEIGIVERGGTVAQTAYGVLADLLEVAQAERMPRWAQGR
jgi:homoserine dehydrogenase